MATEAGRPVRLASGDLSAVMARARAGRWPRLVILGSHFPLGGRPDRWPEWLRAEERIFQLNSSAREQVGKLPSLPDLASLVLWGIDIGDDGARAIAASLTGLTSLDLSDNSIGDDGARAIAASLTGLTSLDLSDNSIGDDGARAIAASLTGLTSLDLSDNSIGADGARAIAASLTGLTSLDLSDNSIGDDGARAIAASPHRPHLARSERQQHRR